MKNYLSTAVQIRNAKLIQHQMICKDCASQQEAERRHYKVICNAGCTKLKPRDEELVFSTKVVNRRFSNNIFDLYELKHGRPMFVEGAATERVVRFGQHG